MVLILQHRLKGRFLLNSLARKRIKYCKLLRTAHVDNQEAAKPIRVVLPVGTVVIPVIDLVLRGAAVRMKVVETTIISVQVGIDVSSS